MNKGTAKIIHKEHGWKVADEIDLKHVQQEYKRTKSTATLGQMIDLSDRIFNGTVKAEFEGGNPYRHMLKEIMNWVTGIDSSSQCGIGDINVYGLNNDEIKILLNNYQVNDINSVCAFLSENDYPYDFLEEAAKQIRSVFSDDTRLILRIEGTDLSEVPYLFVSVITTLPVEEALNKVDQIDQEWLLDNLDRVQGRFNFDVEW